MSVSELSPDSPAVDEATHLPKRCEATHATHGAQGLQDEGRRDLQTHGHDIVFLASLSLHHESRTPRLRAWLSVPEPMSPS